MHEPERLVELEHLHLGYMLMHVRHRDPDARPFRTFADSWFAYYRAHLCSDFVTKGYRPRWLNCGDLASRPPRSRALHARSVEAEEVLRSGRSDPLVRDHIIPLSVLRAALIDSRPENIEDVRSFMMTWYRCALITAEEHASFPPSLSGGMPVGWRIDRHKDAAICLFARYRACGIPLIETETASA